MRRQALWLAIVACALAADARAGDDGAIEINAVRAAAGGINGSVISDPPGFPVLITQPGSYRLTSNLDLDQDVSGRVLAVVEPAMDEGLGPGRRTLLPASHFALSVALADQLAKHPNECTPPLTVEQIAALDALHAQGADDLYVLMPMGRWRRLWKWDGEDLALTRLIP